MEMRKTRMKLAFPTFPQGLLPDPDQETQVKTQTEKEGGLSTAALSRTRDLHPTVSSCRHPTVLVDAGQRFPATRATRRRVALDESRRRGLTLKNTQEQGEEA